MEMGGAHAVSMAWAPAAGATWLGAARGFALGAISYEVSWMCMMAVMMLPSLVPMLRDYRRSVAATRAGASRLGAARLGVLTALHAAGYFAVWGAIGVATYAGGAGVAAAGTMWPLLPRIAPIAMGAVVLAAGVFQFTRWKQQHLSCCRPAPRRPASDARVASAWRSGVRLGAHCAADSAALTAALLAIGMMDLRAMAAVTAAITAERLAPNGARVARAIGVVGMAVGLALLVRAVSGVVAGGWG